MAQNHDLFINRCDVDCNFDVYLNKQVNQCDLTVWSIPVREGITATNRLILESCIESYLLLKFIAVNTGSALTAHINEMLALCYLALGSDMSVGASAEFSINTSPTLLPLAVAIGAENLGHMATIFENANSSLLLGLNIVQADMEKTTGQISSSTVIEAEIENTLKQSLIDATNSINLSSEISDVLKTMFAEGSSNIELGASVVDLLRNVYITAASAVQLGVTVLNIESHHSLGDAAFEIAVDSNVAEMSSEKCVTFENAVTILAEATWALTKVFYPLSAEIIIAAEVVFSCVRRRKLSDITAALSSYTNLTLEDLYYIQC